MNSTNVRQKNRIACPTATTITRANAGSLIDNTGATGSVTITLGDGTPQGSFEPNDFLDIDVPVAQAVVISAGAGAIFVLNGTPGTAGQSLRQSGTAGTSCQLLCIGAGPTFRVRGVNGTWTVS